MGLTWGTMPARITSGTRTGVATTTTTTSPPTQCAAPAAAVVWFGSSRITMLTGANVALGAGLTGGALFARATATATAIAVTDFTASNATVLRRSLAARAQDKTTGTTAFTRIVSWTFLGSYLTRWECVEGATGRREHCLRCLGACQ